MPEKTEDLQTVDIDSLQIEQPKASEQNSLLSEFVESPYVEDSKVLKENHRFPKRIIMERMKAKNISNEQLNVHTCGYECSVHGTAFCFTEIKEIVAN